MNEYTPGPLSIAPSRYGTIILDSEGYDIGEVYFPEPPLGADRMYADAQLWAASPDLLAFAEAAEGLIAWALDNGAAPESTRALETMRAAAVRKAREEA